MKRYLLASLLCVFASLQEAKAQFLGPPAIYPDTTVVSDSSKMIWQVGPPWTPVKIRSMTFAQLLALISVGGLPDYLMVSPWAPGTAYSQNEAALYNNYLCVSSVPGSSTNTGNTPPAPSSNAYWGCYPSVAAVITFLLNNSVFQGN